VPLKDERPVTIPVNITEDKGEQLTRSRDTWVGGVYDGLLALAGLFKDLQQQLKDRQAEKALKNAKESLARQEEGVLRLQKQRENLLKEAKGARLDLSEGDQRLKELQAGLGKLRDFIAGLEEKVQQQNDPKRKEQQAKVSQAQLLEGEAEFGKALELYDQLLNEGLDDADLRKHRDTLKTAWEPKSEKHRQARAFIYDEWPNLDLARMRDGVDQARQAFETCRDAGDVLSPQKLLKAALAHAANLTKTLTDLKPDVFEDDRNTAKNLADAGDKLKKLVQDVNSYLEKAAPVK
jgi:hypothetical protein